MVYFVEEHAFRVLVQKSDRVVFGKAPHVEVFSFDCIENDTELMEGFRIARWGGFESGAY